MKQVSQRYFPRRDFLCKVAIMYRGKFINCKSHDIGEKGIQLALKNEVPVGDEIVVNFFIGGNFISTRAVVKNLFLRNETQCHGVEFTNINFEDRRHIREYIAKQNTNEIQLGNQKVA